MKSSRYSFYSALQIPALKIPGWLILALLVIGIAACTPPFMDKKQSDTPVSTQPVQPKPSTPATVAVQPVTKLPERPAEEPMLEPATRLLNIDSAASEVRIHVYRTGRLKHLGHNHLIISKEVRGTVNLEAEIDKSTVAIEIPVESFVVDDPEQRKAAGRGFDTSMTGEEVENTKRNMLGDRVLNAGRFPAITIARKVSGGTFPELRLEVNITLLGITRGMELPVKVVRNGDQLTASGELSISQSEFGIAPFSILMGSVTVEDEVKIQYRIVAH